MLKRSLLLPPLLSLVAACGSQTKLAEPVRASVQAAHLGRTVELRQSCYFGDLYDENELWLLSSYPFEEIHHIVDLDGKPIHPRNQRGIVPAGARFVVDKIEFPDGDAMARRMLTTPRYNPWIYLRPVEGGPKELSHRRHVILVLPLDLPDQNSIEAEIARMLGPEGSVQDWLATLRPTVKVAIEHKYIVENMTLEQLIAAKGEPRRWLDDKDAGAGVRVAWYPDSEAWMVDGKVTRVSIGRYIEEFFAWNQGRPYDPRRETQRPLPSNKKKVASRL